MSDIWRRVIESLDGEMYVAVERLKAGPYLAAMDSEIERAFAGYMMLATQISGMPMVFGNEVPTDRHCIYLASQVSLGQYRVDFVLGATLHNKNLRRSIAIECDGHDFHEKTREQAARDKARDRFLSTEFGAVLHFTGSEIYRDVAGCWSEALALLNKLQTEGAE